MNILNYHSALFHVQIAAIVHLIMLVVEHVTIVVTLNRRFAIPQRVV